MDIRKIGLVLIFVGIALSVIFIDNHDYLVSRATETHSTRRFLLGPRRALPSSVSSIPALSAR